MDLILDIPGIGRTRAYDDSNAIALARDTSTEHMRGFEGRDYLAHPPGSMPWANMPFPLIPRSEWKERIDEGNKKLLWPLHHQLARKVPIKNQLRTNYCWIYAVTGAIQSVRACSGFPTVELSAASAGAPGKRYRNVGGWTGEAIGYIDEYGLAPESDWPNAAIDNRYFRATRDVAKLYGVGQWFELRPKSFDEVMTCLLLGFPVCVGLMWWGHAVFYSAPVYEGRSFGVVCDNSWGPNWENKGRSVLMESKATPDEANCITTPKLAGDRDRLRSFADMLTAG